MYTEEDRLKAAGMMKREALRCALISGLLIGVGVYFFCIRFQLLCLIFWMLGIFSAIFLMDLRFFPARNYVRWLEEICEGNSHDTVGRIVQIGQEEVYEQGNRFFELILNIYEDGAKEGERRFLTDCGRKFPGALGEIVTVRSYDQFVLEVIPREQEA